MDLEHQGAILRVAREHGAENVAVVLGAPSPGATLMAAQTVMKGDPTYAGPLAGVELGLPAYHILEPAVKERVPAAVYDEQVGVMELVLDTDKIVNSINVVRQHLAEERQGAAP